MTTSESVVRNIQLLLSDFDKTRQAIMEHQTAVILGDDDPTDAEIEYAVAKAARIAAAEDPEEGAVTFPKDGEALTPFEEVCLEAASS